MLKEGEVTEAGHEISELLGGGGDEHAHEDHDEMHKAMEDAEHEHGG